MGCCAFESEVCSGGMRLGGRAGGILPTLTDYAVTRILVEICIRWPRK